jgi:transcriptional regulator of heat shock response
MDIIRITFNVELLVALLQMFNMLDLLALGTIDSNQFQLLTISPALRAMYLVYSSYHRRQTLISPPGVNHSSQFMTLNTTVQERIDGHAMNSASATCGQKADSKRKAIEFW